MILVKRLRKLGVKLKLRHHTLISEQRLHLGRLSGKRVLICPRLREAQIDELEHRLEVFPRTLSCQSFFELTNERTRRRHFPGQHLPKIDQAELAQTARRQHLRRGAGGNVVGITRERSATGTRSAKQDRSEERRVGKECRTQRSTKHYK